MAVDTKGKEFKVGQEVARAVTFGRSARLIIQRVTRVEDGRVYLDNSSQCLRVLDNVVILS